MTHRETRNVFSENAAVFLADLESAVKDGFRVENTIPGYPSLNSILKEVRLFRADQPEEVVPKHDDAVEVRVENYDPMLFLLDVQAAILEGFEVDTQRTSFAPHGLRSAVLVRSEPTPDLATDLLVEPLTEASEEPVEASEKPAAPKTRKRKAKGAAQ